MVNVFIEDPDKLLTKNQKEKLKQKVKEPYTTEQLLSSIHYQDESKKYNDLKVTTKDDDIYLKFQIKSKREELREKLHSVLQEKSRTNDPCWVMYRNLKARGGRFVGQQLPTPTQIKQNKEFYNTQMDQIKTLIPDFENNPMYQYILECVKN